MDTKTQQQYAETFRGLHKKGDPLVLFNAWDVATAKAIAKASPAVATSSWVSRRLLGIRKEVNMPFIRCDIRRGRSAVQKKRLFDAINGTVSRITGAPKSAILILIEEHAGNHFMEGGELLPDYVAGPNGEDLAAEAALKRQSN